MRLIDADAFIGYLGLDEENARKENLGGIVTLEDFDRQPTAYDINKVMEKLEKMSNDVLSNIFAYEEDDHVGIYNDGLSNGYEKSIEIVKVGLEQ